MQDRDFPKILDSLYAYFSSLEMRDERIKPGVLGDDVKVPIFIAGHEHTEIEGNVEIKSVQLLRGQSPN